MSVIICYQANITQIITRSVLARVIFQHSMNSRFKRCDLNDCLGKNLLAFSLSIHKSATPLYELTACLFHLCIARSVWASPQSGCLTSINEAWSFFSKAKSIRNLASHICLVTSGHSSELEDKNNSDKNFIYLQRKNVAASLWLASIGSHAIWAIYVDTQSQSYKKGNLNDL